MKSKSKRLLSLLFSLAVMLVLVAAPVYAEGDVTEDTSTDTTEVSVVAEVLYASGAQLGTYSTFEEAVTAASTGQTVRLLSDYTLTTAFDYGRAQQITIDLNGYKISADSDVVSSTYGAVIALSYNGQWTIKDSSETQTGKIEVSGSAAKMLFYNRGTIILESGSLNFLDYSGSSSNPAVITNQYATYASGTFIMTGGTLTFSTTTGSFAYAVVNNNTDTTSPAVSISGGTINVPKGKWGTSVFSFADGSNYSITGGTFTTDPSDYVADGYVAVENADGTYTVTECVYLGASAGTASVPAVVVSGAGTNTVVAKVSGAYVGTDGEYSTSSYPTTDMTYTSADSNDSGAYIFAGWYTDEACTTACDASMWTGSTEAYYYAKFVDANALKVACVFTPASITGSGNAWRFVSSWASTKQDAVLFVVNEVEYIADTYYGSYQVGTNMFYPDDFSSASVKVSSYGIVEDENATPMTSCTVRAGWLTSDGTKIYGASYTFNAPIGATAQTVLSSDAEAVVVELGVSNNSEATVSATVASGLGTSTVYVEVSGKYVGTDGYYSTSSYPTTSLTHTPSADTNDSGSYIFAGWYTSNDGVSLTACTSSMWESTSAEINYYAMFVDANALQVACVFTPASITGSGNAWRFVSSWASTKQDAVLFVVNETENSIDTYYGSYQIGSSIMYYPSDFSSASVKVSSYGFVETAEAAAVTSCTVQAGWLTQDGTKVYGETYVFAAPESATEQTVLEVVED